MFVTESILTATCSSITLLECVNNFLEWSGEDIPAALNAVTATPAAMMGVKGVKGTLDADADADLIIFSDHETAEGRSHLVLDEVWKFGTKVFSSEESKA